MDWESQGEVISVNAGLSKGEGLAEIKDDLEKLWQWENIGIRDNPQVDDDDVALEQFQRSLRLLNGRYEAGWPWIRDDPELSTNLAIARRRLIGTWQRLAKSPKLLKKYDQIIQEQRNLEIVELAPVEKDRSENAPLVTYLPHHPVVREDKATTKVRIVYDASAKGGPGTKSLNQCLYRGPVFLPDLAGMLLRFSVGSQHATVREHLKKEASSLSEEIKQNIYSDNVLLFANSETEAIEKCRKAYQIFKRANMNLREFVSNNAAVNFAFGDQSKEFASKFLGVHWDPKTDLLEYVIAVSEEDFLTAPSKRIVLQKLAKIFDPLGLLSPVVFLGKSFLQELWRSKYGWDETLKDDDRLLWHEVLRSWQSKPLFIPRLATANLGEEGIVELHVFTDASAKGCCVAVFLRHLCGSDISCWLVYAKTKLNPIKEITVPRLELVGVVLGKRAVLFVAKQLNKEHSRLVLWSDSQIALGWINSSSSNLPVFVRNRVNEVRALEQLQIGFVGTSENPADHGTRGLSMDEVRNNVIWWNGPPWLLQPEETWPFAPAAIRKFVTHEVVSNAATTATPVELFPLERYSTHSKATRVVGWILRFLRNRILTRISVPPRGVFLELIRETGKGELSNKEVVSAQEILIRQDQALFPPLNKERDDYGLWTSQRHIVRCSDRIRQIGGSFASKHPMFLARRSPLMKLIVLDIHARLMHAGVPQTLAEYRQVFWSPAARERVKRILRRDCMHCRRLNARPYTLPPMSPLPRERVVQAAAFQNVGLDYLGPILFRGDNPKVLQKIWVALFTCMVTRAVHLEVVYDLSTYSFIQAFRKFIARRGRPNLILSDNGSQFVLAAKVLSVLRHQSFVDPSVDSYLSNLGIEWRFIPQLSPWHGGLYERMVGLVKQAFKKCIGRRILQREEAVSVFAEIEAIINCRPLSYIYEGPECVILRPIDLIGPSRNYSAPNFGEDVITDIDYIPSRTDPRDQIIRMWKHATSLLDRFWFVWHTEYLLSLRERAERLVRQGRTTDVPPRKGEVVLVAEPNQPRGQWKLARIVDLPAQHAMQARVAKVKIGGKIFTRPLSMLLPLEAGGAPTEDDRPEQAMAPPPDQNSEGDAPFARQVPPAAPEEALPEVDVEEEVRGGESEEEDVLVPRYSRNSSRKHLQRKLTAPKRLFYTIMCLLFFSLFKSAVAQVCEFPPSRAVYDYTRIDRRTATESLCRTGSWVEREEEVRRCDLSEKLTAISGKVCQRIGVFLFFSVSKGSFCHISKKCALPHTLLSWTEDKSLTCNHACKCPLWSTGCSFASKHEAEADYAQLSMEGRMRTMSDKEVDEFLRSLRPVECRIEGEAITPGNRHCTRKGQARLHLVELFNGSLVYVREYRLQHLELIGSERRCATVGPTESDGRTCKNRETCVSGTRKVCWHDHVELTFLDPSNERSLPIKAWGTVRATVYRPPSKAIHLPDCPGCQVRCSNNSYIVTWDSHIDQVERCTVNECHRNHTDRSGPTSLEGELGVNDFPRLVRVQWWKEGRLVKESEIECPYKSMHDKCHGIECSLCKSIFTRPECHPVGTPVSLTLIVYMIFLSCTIPVLIWLHFSRRDSYTVNRGPRRFLPLSLQRRLGLPEPLANPRLDDNEEETAVEMQPVPQQAPHEHSPEHSTTDSEDTSPNYATITKHSRQPSQSTTGTHSLRIAPLTRSSLYAVTVCLGLMMATVGEACSQTSTLSALTESCAEEENGTLRCTFHQSLLATLETRGQEHCLLLRNHKNEPMGTLKFFVASVKTICQPDIHLFTRPSEIKVASSKRCYLAGSCQTGACSNVSTHHHISELGEANDYPGQSYCEDSCGCWGCGCFMCSAACLFYRTYTVPTEKTIATVFSCPLWKIEVNVKVILERNHLTLYETLTFGLDSTVQKFQGITFQLQNLITPPVAFITDRFITDGNRIAIVPPSYPIAVKCATIEDALGSSGSTIPGRIHSSLEIRRYLLRANTQALAWLLVVRKGAEFAYSCRTKFGNTIGHVECPSANFSVNCNLEELDPDGMKFTFMETRPNQRSILQDWGNISWKEC